LKDLIGLFLKRPFTAFLVWLFRFYSHFRPRPAPDSLASDLRSSASSILIFSTAGIGDTLSDTPAIRAVKESFPMARVTVVVHEKRKDLLAANPWIDRLIPHRKNPFRFFKTLRAVQSDRPASETPALGAPEALIRPRVAIVLRANDPDIWPLAYLSGAPAVVSRRESTVFPFLVNVPVDVPDWPNLPGVLQTLAVVKAIGAQASDCRIVYRVTEDDRREFQKTWSGPTDHLVAVQIHHSPRLAFRDWPASSFVALCEKILAAWPRLSICLTGGPADINKARRITEAVSLRDDCPRLINVAGKLTLRQTAVLLERSTVFITTDTGLMHLGFALQIPTLAMLHPYNAGRVGPYGYGAMHTACVMAGPPADGAGNLRPLSELSCETVFEAFKDLYVRHIR